MFKMLLRNNEIILFCHNRDKIELKCLCRRMDPQTDVRPTPQHRDRHGHVGIFFVLISIYVFRIQAQLLYFIIEKNPCTGSGLSVDKCNIIADEILNTFDSHRVSRRYNQTLVPKNQFNQICPDIGQVFFYI